MKLYLEDAEESIRIEIERADFFKVAVEELKAQLSEHKVSGADEEDDGGENLRLRSENEKIVDYCKALIEAVLAQAPHLLEKEVLPQ